MNQRHDVNFLTVQEFADRLKMHPGSIRKAIKYGKIYASRPGIGKKSPFRIPESELERLHYESIIAYKK